MRRLTIDKRKCPGRNLCQVANSHVLDTVELDGCIKLAKGGWADNLENNQLFDRLRARCPHKAIVVTG